MPSYLILRLLLAALAGVLWQGAAWGAVPNKAAVPAYAEEQTILQAEKDTPEPGFTSAASGRVHIDRHYIGQYGASEEAVILQRGGNTWRVLRNGPIAATSGFLLLAVPLLIAGFYLRVGPSRSEEVETGRRIERFDRWQRIVHWSTAISFLVLALTGLIILFGKKLLMPWMGHDLFAWIAVVAKYVHNFVGPVFIVCSVVMFLTFVRDNFFRPWDWEWIKGLGGLLSHKRIPAGYFNAGEKLWFWFGVVLLGLVMSLSGLMLDFVNFGQTRYLIQLADYLHLTGATLYIAAAMGHIYLGTLGTPGTYEGMRYGTVDEAWAKTHHEIWYEEVKAGAPPAAPSGEPPAVRPRPGY
jgi:formate dehydrogenase subunit gamma